MQLNHQGIVMLILCWYKAEASAGALEGWTMMRFDAETTLDSGMNREVVDLEKHGLSTLKHTGTLKIPHVSLAS